MTLERASFARLCFLLKTFDFISILHIQQELVDVTKITISGDVSHRSPVVSPLLLRPGGVHKTRLL